MFKNEELDSSFERKNHSLHSLVNDRIPSVGVIIPVDDKDMIAIGSGIVVCWWCFHRFVSSNTVSNEYVPFTIQGIRSGETVAVDSIVRKITSLVHRQHL